MVLRAVVGVCAGVVGGLGTMLTYEGLMQYCALQRDQRDCVATEPGTLPLTFVFWAVAASVLIALGFRAARQEHWLPPAVIGSALWLVLLVAAFAFQYTDPETPLEDRPPSVFPAAAIVAPCVAYAFATSVAGRARKC